MMFPFVYGWTSLVESSVIGVAATVAAAVLKGRFTKAVFETATRNTLFISCMFMWVILAALAFGAVFDGWARWPPSTRSSPNSWASRPGPS